MGNRDTYPCCGVERNPRYEHDEDCPQRRQAEALEEISKILDGLANKYL